MNRKDLVLRRPVEELVVPDAQIRLAEHTVAAWDIDRPAAHALTVLGLPLVERVGFIADEEPDPGLHTLRDGARGYRIGSFSHQDVYLVPATGHVVGQPEDPELGPAGFINSSAGKYVESAWRYYWLHQLLDDSLSDETYEALQDFLARIVEIDPLVGHDPVTSMWPAVVSGW